jgi:hypothetical protein
MIGCFFEVEVSDFKNTTRGDLDFGQQYSFFRSLAVKPKASYRGINHSPASENAERFDATCRIHNYLPDAYHPYTIC